MTKIIQFIAGILLLICLEIFKADDNMPTSDSVGLYLRENIFWFRVIGWLIIIFPALTFFTSRTVWTKIMVIALLIAYAIIFYVYNH